MQNTQFGSKIKNAKKVRKTFVNTHKSCSMQKTALKPFTIPKMKAF